MKNTVLLITSLALGSIQMHSQDIENIIAAGKEDASVYLGNYMQPVYKGLIYNLNSGWYHSGKTHKKLGFDITINATASFVPDKAKTFEFKNSDYQFLELQSGNASEDLPTVMGPVSTSRIVVKNRTAGGAIIPNEFLPSFETLNGIENELPIAAIPSPMVQVGLGLPTKTDIKVRFVPSVGNNEVKFNLIGIGLQHDILQHFIDSDKVPIIDLSILGAYTTSTTVYAPANNTIGVNQETTIKINAYTVQLVANANLKIINFYAGLGYVAGDASTQVKGTYSYAIQDNLGVPTGSTVSIVDPIDIDYKMKSGVKATLGARLNIAWFKIFADYSIQDYNTLNAGIAFSFR